MKWIKASELPSDKFPDLEEVEGQLEKSGVVHNGGAVYLRFKKNSYWLKIEKQSTVTMD